MKLTILAGPAVQARLRLYPEEGRPPPALRALRGGRGRQRAPADPGRCPEAGDHAVDGTRVDVRKTKKKKTWAKSWLIIDH